MGPMGKLQHEHLLRRADSVIERLKVVVGHFDICSGNLPVPDSEDYWHSHYFNVATPDEFYSVYEAVKEFRDIVGKAEPRYFDDTDLSVLREYMALAEAKLQLVAEVIDQCIAENHTPKTEVG